MKLLEKFSESKKISINFKIFNSELEQAKSFLNKRNINTW
jgi:hypothetical protein